VPDKSEQVLVVANRLERLVVDLESAQRGFVITSQKRFLQPWRDAQVAFRKTEALAREGRVWLRSPCVLSLTGNVRPAFLGCPGC